jgi:hypothetical protein
VGSAPEAESYNPDTAIGRVPQDLASAPVDGAARQSGEVPLDGRGLIRKEVRKPPPCHRGPRDATEFRQKATAFLNAAV